MAIFNSFLYVYQRIWELYSYLRRAKSHGFLPENMAEIRCHRQDFKGAMVRAPGTDRVPRTTDFRDQSRWHILCVAITWGHVPNSWMKKDLQMWNLSIYKLFFYHPDSHWNILEFISNSRGHGWRSWGETDCQARLCGSLGTKASVAPYQNLPANLRDFLDFLVKPMILWGQQF